MSLVSFGKVRSAAMNSLNGNVLPIAIDFGVSSLKLLQLAVGDPPSLVAAASLPTPENLIGEPGKRFEFQFQALPKLIRSVGFKGKRAMCAIPSAQMFCKHMQFPKSDSVDVAELVREAVPEALGCAPEALIYRHIVVPSAVSVAGSAGAPGANGGAGVKQEVICMAASRQFIGQIMDAIRESKLEPVGMHPECQAAIRAFDQINRREHDARVVTLYLDIALGSTKAWITQGSNIVFAKTIAVGGRDLDIAVARSLECDLPSAHARRLNASVLVAEAARASGVPRASGSGAPPAAHACGGLAILAAAMSKDASEPAAAAVPDATAVAEDRRFPSGGLTAPGLTMDVAAQNQAPVASPDFDIREPLEMMTDEIAGCLRYYQALFGGKRIDRVIFMGGESRHRGLCQHIARRIKSPAHVADPLARMARTGKEPCHGVDFGAMQPGWTTVFGLGMCPTDF